MENSIKTTLICLMLFSGICLILKTNTFKKSLEGKSKLTQYFNQIPANNNAILNDYKQLIVDSIKEIKQNSAKINFVEISQFTDSISVRWIIECNTSKSNLVKFNHKKSKHIGTTYITIPKNYKFLNNDLKKVVAAIEFSLVHNSNLKVKEVVGNYLAENIKTCNVFYLDGGNAVNAISNNLGNSTYKFDIEKVDNASLYVVEHLLVNYSFEKFKKLWNNGFTNFKNIYGFSFGKMTLQREKLAVLATKNESSINWERFNKCM